ncbi:MAG: response regulator [Candidatus Omnitrophota bacterium]
MAEQNKNITILLVEDNPGDVRLIREALKESAVLKQLFVVEDGVEAMAFLRKQGKYAQSPSVCLIILDLNLPKKDGREVLTEIKKDDKLRIIPVIVLTSSEAEDDINKTYYHYANCYISKPPELIQFIKVVLSIENFWLTLAKLPACS